MIQQTVCDSRLRVISLFTLFCLLGGVCPSLRAQGASKEDVQPPVESRTGAIAQVIANQKRMESNLDLYERVQRVEIRRLGTETSPQETKVLRIFPSGAATTKIPLSPTGEPSSAQSYRTDLEKLVKYLAWVVQDGSAQREAYAKAERKRKERFDLIESTQGAFLFTRSGTDQRGDRTLVKYTMRPNPAFKPTTRNAMIFSRVSGTVWIDEQSGELAKIEGIVTEDISIAMFLAKVYKGSQFMQERYEYFPGIWFPSYEQYDFDGRKFLVPFSIHERTFYSDYKKVGPPADAITVVRAELDKLPSQ
jgi:hypothetical protein